jgi:YesN/AraC family two-component response regulator
MTVEDKFRVLVVDDEKNIQEMLSRHFRFLGFDVITANNGKEALEVMDKQRCDVVISDIKMPVMDGVELIRQVHKQYPMTHVIMITGYVTMENVLACMRHGADTCIYKPLTDLKELEDAVQRAVDHLKHWQEKLKSLLKMKR